MAITQVITTLPDAPDPATDTRDEFSTKAAASVLAQKAMVPELNAWAAEVNAIAATAVGDVATAVGAASADTPAGTDEVAWRKTATGLLKKTTFTNLLTWFAAVAGSASQVFSAANFTTAQGVTFPATQNPSADPNTLDDYEEGNWTPNQGAGLTLVGAFSSSGKYVKNGRSVTITGSIVGTTSVALAAGGVICTNLPFTTEAVRSFGAAMNAAGNTDTVVYANTSSTTAAGVGVITATPNITFSITYLTT